MISIGFKICGENIDFSIKYRIKNVILRGCYLVKHKAMLLPSC